MENAFTQCNQTQKVLELEQGKLNIVICSDQSLTVNNSSSIVQYVLDIFCYCSLGDFIVYTISATVSVMIQLRLGYTIYR